MKSDDVDRMIEEMTASKMSERTKELAEQAGFVLWPDGGPFGEVIDWASSYDMELEKFAELIGQDEREAVLEAVEALTGMEADRHKMFSEGYDFALYHIRQVVEGRSKK